MTLIHTEIYGYVEQPGKKPWYAVHAPDSGRITDFAILEGDPITGTFVACYGDLGTAHYYARLHNQHRSTSTALNEFDAMYASEISFVLVGMWDGGIDWHVGNGPSVDSMIDNAAASGNARSIEEALIDTTNAARRAYPQSTFASGRRSDVLLCADQRTVEDLSKELGAKAPFSLHFDQSDPDPYATQWTVEIGDKAYGGYSAEEALKFALEQTA